MNKKLLHLLAALFALALFASACGSDSDDSDSASADTSDSADTDEAMDEEEDSEAVGGAVDEEEAAAAVEEAGQGETQAEEQAVDIEALMAEWDVNRAALIEEIKAGGYGVNDENVLIGPGGFTLDLNDCPADWSDTAGINDGVVTIGHTTALSGNLAFYGNIANGMEAYWNLTNEAGGFGPDGLQLEIVVKDDGYVATQTKELVDEILQTEDPFYVITLGSPNTFAVQETLNEACVPQPFSMTGHQAWGDPENFPWTSGLQMSYATEALLWGSWIEANLEGPVNVAALVMDNDFGLAYEQGFEEFAENSSVIDNVEFVRHDPAAATLTNEVTTLAAGDPDVFISMTAGTPCVLATQEAARAGITTEADAVFQPSVCKSVAAVMGPAGEAAADWLIFGGGWKDNADPQYANDTYIAWMNEQLEAAGLDPNAPLVGTGFGQFGWAHLEALKIASELDGGLSRTNFMIATRALRLDHPGLIEGIAFGANGNEDAYFVEGSDLSRFDVENQSWIIEGAIIDLDGQSPNCAWVAGEGC